ncbi:hypothetical protein EV421DRAFT_604988 [Armillaria borealis]|uniref:Uncharacterized protein n=1 Tax=Armillaria borealis TaxID=47425 RepID=A0AA39M507_9AGAR|nr:hypothetical protein EV421DRAFT_604988 [Armillaria borealis]
MTLTCWFGFFIFDFAPTSLSLSILSVFVQRVISRFPEQLNDRQLRWRVLIPQCFPTGIPKASHSNPLRVNGVASPERLLAVIKYEGEERFTAVYKLAHKKQRCKKQQPIGPESSRFVDRMPHTGRSSQVKPARKVSD